MMILPFITFLNGMLLNEEPTKMSASERAKKLDHSWLLISVAGTASPESMIETLTLLPTFTSVVLGTSEREMWFLQQFLLKCLITFVSFHGTFDCVEIYADQNA